MVFIYKVAFLFGFVIPVRDKFMILENLKKLTYIVNTVILILVFGLMGFFYIIKATFLVYFSIPTALVYLIGYVMISRNHLYGYVCFVYMWLTLYMGVTTICLGYGYGFHLYGMSMIPIIFYSGYLGRRISSKHIKALYVSVGIVIVYLISTLIPSFRGPIYVSNLGYDVVFWIINSITVFGFLIFYTNLMIGIIIDSEERLKKLALEDNLTGLNNRHYMLSHLEVISGEDKDYYLAMADIDDFKKINDIYGHNAGDYILKTIAEIMKATCKDSLICRWGGEEFLILGKDKNKAVSELEKLRKNVSDKRYEFEGKQIKVTITIGVAERRESENIDKWIQRADEKLYEGKNSGKDKVLA